MAGAPGGALATGAPRASRWRRRGAARRCPLLSAALVLGLGAPAGGARGGCQDAGVVDLEFTSLASNNLAGRGPDTDASPNIRYLYVAQVGNVPVDLLVEAGEAYRPGDPALNGQQGPYARISVAGGATADIRLGFRRSGTSAGLAMRGLNLTLFDLDSHSQSHLAMVTVRSYSAFHLPSESSLWHEAGENGLTCEVGDQIGNAMTFEFEEVSQVSLRLEVAAEAASGRSFYLSASTCDLKPRAVLVSDEGAQRVSDAEPGGGARADHHGGDGASRGHAPAGPEEVEFNCSAGLDRWQGGWSGEKKRWCCEHAQVGCTPQGLHGGDDSCTPRAVSSCSGREVQLATCEGLPSCSDACVPRDCELEDWSGWKAMGSCSGLCERKRRVNTSNNECGAPCEGALSETSARPECLQSSCAVEDRNCTWDAWEDWAPCASKSAQSFRSRRAKTEQSGRGESCTGGWNETRPCGGPEPVDCVLTDWGEWTTCSASCGGGVKTNMRRVKQRAAHGGRPCAGATRQTVTCSATPCEAPVNCTLGDWSDWAGCSSIVPTQRLRRREVLSPPGSAGPPCDEALKETAGCALPASARGGPAPCEYDDWSAWSECTSSCGGGQSERMRSLVHQACAPNASGEVDLRQARPCGTQPCEGSTCEFSDWGEWGDCSATCGQGQAARKRSVAGPVEPWKPGCTGALEEVRNCSARASCVDADCEWGDWGAWGACSATCGGGAKRRDRVIRTQQSGKGAACSAKVKSEVAPCSTRPCEDCVDGDWGGWDEWSPCTATCGPAFRVRHREVAKYANACGKPASGVMDQFALCVDLGPCSPPQDCEVSDWGAWSSCGSKCYGVSERSRKIVSDAAYGGAQCGNESLREIVTCNPGPGEPAPEGCEERSLPSPCKFEPWGDWGACSSSCGGGQRTRQRHPVAPHGRPGGAPCEGALAETEACGTASCNQTCQDCAWGDWTAWGACSRYGAQRFRHRAVELPGTGCGKPCAPGHAKEVENCTAVEGAVPKSFCAWAPWSAESPCDAVCGAATRTRQRQLRATSTEPEDTELLFAGDPDSPCSGAQIMVTACDLPSCNPGCKPVDCEFSAWSQWSAPSCDQLCQRHRVIERIGSCGGDFCDGPFVETKRCPRDCEQPDDCVLGDWSEWSGSCHAAEEQRSRTRVVERNASHGGKACRGSLLDTRSCRTTCTPRDCEVAAWSAWGACSRSCGGGVRLRSRHISAEAACGGSPCDSSLEQQGACGLEACDPGADQDCTLSDWTDWDKCDGEGQQTREREVLGEASGRGEACEGTTRQTRLCGSDVDCEVSDWTAWDECDSFHGQGQQQRQRQVVRTPTGRGRGCPPALAETRGCTGAGGPEGDGHDCEVSDWGDWAACSASCGQGSRSRGRLITKLASDGGAGCNLALSQMAPCSGLDCGNATGLNILKVDCAWEPWSDWGPCSLGCGGGQHNRSRNVSTLPRNGGRPCAAEEPEQIAPCNTQPCGEENCVDAEWADWSPWEECSVSCKGGGTTRRSRKVGRHANHCGRPAAGLSAEAASCNEDVPCEPTVDCSFEDWSTWSACAKPCEGVQNRSREITVGAGGGTACEGSLRQSRSCADASAGCNISSFALPGGPCTFQDWTDWADCPCSCGGCQQLRRRGWQRPQGSPGCSGAMAATRACGTEPCEAPCGEPVDCAWSHWSDWSECEGCAGPRNRSRSVARPPSCGGAPCRAGAAEEVGRCPHSCDGGGPQYCSWADWGAWSGCGAACGSATKKRERVLQVSKAAPAYCSAAGGAGGTRTRDALQGKFALLHQRAAALETRRLRELALAFVLGCAAILAAPRALQGVRWLLCRARQDRARFVAPVCE